MLIDLLTSVLINGPICDALWHMHNWKDHHLCCMARRSVLCEAARVIEQNYPLFFGFTVNKHRSIVLPQGYILNVRGPSQGLILHLEMLQSTCYQHFLFALTLSRMRDEERKRERIWSWIKRDVFFFFFFFSFFRVPLPGELADCSKCFRSLALTQCTELWDIYKRLWHIASQRKKSPADRESFGEDGWEYGSKPQIIRLSNSSRLLSCRRKHIFSTGMFLFDCQILRIWFKDTFTIY